MIENFSKYKESYFNGNMPTADECDKSEVDRIYIMGSKKWTSIMAIEQNRAKL